MVAKPILQIKDLAIKFQSTDFTFQAVHNASFTVTQGSCKALVGESGSGKTLTALSIMQLLPESALISKKSKVLWHGNDLLNHSESQIKTELIN